MLMVLRHAIWSRIGIVKRGADAFCRSSPTPSFGVNIAVAAGIRCGHRSFLTAGEAAIALRPFYFVVHPDLFGQHPRERAVNEESLKQLRELLDNIQIGQTFQPRRITFYVREGKKGSNSANAGFRMVTTPLLSNDMYKTVESVLQTCQLPLDFLHQIKDRRSKVRQDKPTQSQYTARDYSNEFLRMYGPDNPNSAYFRKMKMNLSLRSWLRANVLKAQSNQQLHDAMKKYNAEICAALCEEFGLADVQWNCIWSDRFLKGCIVSFRRMCERNVHIRNNLKGHVLVFAEATGMCVEGHVILDARDVPNDWIHLLSSLNEYKEGFEKNVRIAEEKLSKLLHGLRVLPRHKGAARIVLVHEYYNRVMMLEEMLRQYKTEIGVKELLPKEMSDLDMVLEGLSGSLSVSTTGSFVVPMGVSPERLLTFLRDKTGVARQTKATHQRLREKEESLIVECQREFQLASLVKDISVSSEQMVVCCEALLREPREINRPLPGGHIQVSQYYDVNYEGELCIPWNWASLGK
ncbi:T-cell activation inhibitor, mitochondrial [Lingula anatina]|uniref:T-cell activation inhibitor, mitochondrial n=1 Tax=Lingula anatina TaxID=7574 RepID=A0A1S3HT20_LINAN|nr:T-cell activation inhibitor, mitochondrial [Lingula anatina]|eukprot:XP_013389185.1 T-cell activation inhibitor, mitochondrial [Lingula anatina]